MILVLPSENILLPLYPPIAHNLAPYFAINIHDENK